LFSALQAGFELRSAYDGTAALQLVPEFLPDCILLDIHMPGKNGYEICTALKSKSATGNIPIIILSSKVSMQEKILGFELGAEDYLVKSTEPEFLKAKVVRAIEQYREKSRLEQGVLEAQSAAFEALSSSADLGCCIRFVERTYAMHSFAQLAEGLFHTMGEFGLRISLMFTTPAGAVFYTHGGQDISPLEKEMFNAVHNEGRFCDFGERTFCNFEHASILIKNMPLNKPEHYGRIKDAVPWVMGATDSKVKSLNDMQNIVKQVDQAKLLLADSQSQLGRVIGSGSESKEVVDAITAKLGEIDGIFNSIKATLLPDTESSEDAVRKEIFSSGIDFF
jgi:DNA-binding response OmpR family regulator